MKLEPPNDIDALCAELGFGMKRRARLADESGDGLLPYLQECWVWARKQDDSRWMRQSLPGAVPAGRTRKKSDGIVRGSPRSGVPRVVDDRPRRNRRRRVVKPPTDVEILEAAEASAYTDNRYLAPEDDESPSDTVPAWFQNVLSMQAKSRSAEYRRENDPDAEAQADVQRLSSELRELAKRAVKMGVDPAVVLAPIVREIEAQHRGLRKAA